jgi:hypothetical protein
MIRIRDTATVYFVLFTFFILFVITFWSTSMDYNFNTPFVHPLYFSHFLRKVVSVINVAVLCINITKLSFVCMCIKFDYSYFKTS